MDNALYRRNLRNMAKADRVTDEKADEAFTMKAPLTKRDVDEGEMMSSGNSKHNCKRSKPFKPMKIPRLASDRVSAKKVEDKPKSKISHILDNDQKLGGLLIPRKMKHHVGA